MKDTAAGVKAARRGTGGATGRSFVLYWSPGGEPPDTDFVWVEGIGPPAPLARILDAAHPGDWALLTGRSPGETVEAAEALLRRGLWTVIEVRDYPALARALGRRRWGRECVVLSPEPPSRAALVALRLRDVLVAGAGLAALAPFFGAVALLIKRSSPGPVLFATEVVGRNGQTFVWHKLRSMRVGSATDDVRRREQYRAFLADQRGAARQATASRKVIDEARVTGIGRFLRRHSLDELPQLWNVLKGEMTLVGPRPCLPYEYGLHEPWQRLRYRVTPGLTGPWQAYGRSKVAFDEMALMDYCYSYMRSFWLDLRLILRTALVVVTGEGGR